MFSVKQETNSGHKIWPGVMHVYTDCLNASGITDVVSCLFEAGGDIQFCSSAGRNTIYVMNESGATVARYDLGNRLPGAAIPDGAAAAQLAA